MNNNPHQKLIKLFQRLPGIGPRQATRFVYSLADENEATIKELAALLIEIGKIGRCKDCFQIAEKGKNKCYICSSSSRDKSAIIIIEKDTDLMNIESSNIFNGHYHILGGTISPLKTNDQPRERLKQLYKRIKSSPHISEIILATSATTEGEHTARYIEKILEPFKKERKIKISRLGRGLSTGTELEYSDHETIKNAIKNRK